MVRFFENGYGISVICKPGSYGYEEGLAECAMLKGTETEYNLVYPAGTSFEMDVVGWCEPEDVLDLINEVKNYKG